MVEKVELETLLDNALEDFNKEPTETSVTPPKTEDVTDFTSLLQLNTTNDEQYIEELTKEFDKTFTRFLEATPELQSTLNLVSPESDVEEDIQNNITKTMENLFSAHETQAGQSDNHGNTAQPGNPEAMMPILEGLLSKLLSKEVLQEPLQELCTMYPDWLSDNQDHPKYQTYKKQYDIVKSVCDIFDRCEGESEGSKIYQLLCDMQETGPPPEDIVTKMSQDLPGGMLPPMPRPAGPHGGEEQCCVQ